MLYDSDMVLSEYGVPPNLMVTLRAFLGDTSDNIPGVPRVPAKVITKLVRAYETIDAVYKSNLVSLTKYQFEKLREAEVQVRLNIPLMTLDTRAPFMLLSPDANPKVVQERLLDVEVKSEPLLAAFFGGSAGPEVREHERIRDPG